MQIKEVCTLEEQKQFVQLPFDLYKNSPFWVPSMKKDELEALQKGKNPALDFCDTQFWIAWQGGKCVGRIGAIINPIHNEKTGEKNIRFTRFECIKDTAVATALLETAEQWGQEKGMTDIVGPLGFSNLDHQGMLIEGFDYLPSVASEYHHPYYQTFFENKGYEKEIDWVEFRLTFPEVIPEKASRVAEMVKKRYQLEIIHPQTKKELFAYKDRVFEVFNSAFKDLYSTYVLNQEMIDFYCNKYFNVLNPKLIKFVSNQAGDLLGFIICMPSLSEAMQKAKGKLLPWGWYHLHKALNKPKEADLMLTGVIPEALKMGVSSLLVNELWKELSKLGVQYVETTGMLETNQQAISYWKNFENIQHKRKRCFRKKIDS